MYVPFAWTRRRKQGSEGERKSQETAPSRKITLGEDAVDVDIMIRLTQYAALALQRQGSRALGLQGLAGLK